jgi:glucose-6-phosphate 1-dehydrogenase
VLQAIRQLTRNNLVRGQNAASRNARTSAGETPYERLLTDALAGNGALFTREDIVEAVWAVVDPVLVNPHRTIAYARGSWGPQEADALMAPDGHWYSPAASGNSTASAAPAGSGHARAVSRSSETRARPRVTDGRRPR